MTDGRKVLEEALRVKQTRGTIAATEYLVARGFDYDFAMLALVGLRNAALHYGIEVEHVQREQRGRSFRKIRPLRLVKGGRDA